VSSRPGRDTLSLLGYIQAAVHDPELGGSVAKVTQYVHQAYAQRYLALGEQPPTIAFGELNQALGQAFAQRRAQVEVQRSLAQMRESGNDVAITREHLAPSFHAAPGAQPSETSRLQVRYSYLTGDPNLPVESFRTYIPEVPGPATLAELEDLIEQDAIASSEDYGEFYLERTGYLSIEFY
jgi:hypothetical protein